MYAPRGGIYQVRATGYSPTAAAIAQSNANAQNAELVSATIERGRANMAMLERAVIKENTLMPGEWYGGQLHIAGLQGRAEGLHDRTVSGVRQARDSNRTGGVHHRAPDRGGGSTWRQLIAFWSVTFQLQPKWLMAGCNGEKFRAPMKLGLIYKYGKLFPLFVVKSKKVGVILILSECMARWARLIFL